MIVRARFDTLSRGGDFGDIQGMVQRFAGS